MRESRKERGRFSTLTASAFLRCVSRSAREYNSRPPRVATFMGGTAPLTPAPQPLPGARGAIALSHSTEHAMLPGPHIRGHSWSKTTPHARSLQHRSRARKPELQKFVLIRVHSWFKKPSPAKTLQDRSRARNPELQKFVLIRVHSWFKKHHSRGPFRAELGLETQSYKNSCLFVFIRGSKNTTRKVPSGQSSGAKARAT